MRQRVAVDPQLGKSTEKSREPCAGVSGGKDKLFFWIEFSSLLVPTGKGSSWKQSSLTNRTNTSLKSDCLENSQPPIPGSKEMF